MKEGAMCMIIVVAGLKVVRWRTLLAAAGTQEGEGEEPRNPSEKHTG